MRAGRTLPLLAAFAAIYVIWGSTFLAIKVVVGYLPPLLMAGVRSLVAGVILLAWARLRGTPRPSPTQWRDGVAAGALMFLLGHGTLFWASQHMASGLAAVLESTAPIWIAAFDAASRSGSAPGLTTVTGLALGFGGVVWLNLPGTGADLAPVVSGVVLLGAAAWALASIWYRGARRPDSALQAAALPLVGGGALLLIVSAALGEPARVAPGAINTTTVLAMAYLIVFGSVVAFSAYLWLLKVVSAASVSSYAYVNPVVALLLGGLLGGESLAPGTLGPVGVILAAVVIIVAGEARRARRAPALRARSPAPFNAPREDVVA
jgi:drug/metabolite transporter (DMT)-like permease